MYKKIFENIELNKPVLIKKFIQKDEHEDSIKDIIKLSKLSNKKNNFLSGSKYIKSNKNLLINTILNELKKNDNIKIYDEYRIWNHEKNNITPWHYDGNGIDVINICFNGKKKFILSEPNSQITFPFTNITIINTSFKQEYILEPGDLLLIPRFWFHKVISLESETITINFCLTNSHDNIPNNLKMLYNLHNLFKTTMSKEYICSYPNIKIKLENIFYYYIKENILLFILFLTLRFLIKKMANINFSFINNLDKLLLIFFYTEHQYQTDSVGMSRLLFVNSLFNNLIIDKLI